MSRDDDEIIAIQISGILNGLCPAFKRESKEGSGVYEWHKCRCTVNGGTCSCVWHTTDTCSAGKWRQLSFAADRRKVQKAKREKALNKVREVIAHQGGTATTAQEVEEIDRFEMLDMED